MLKTLKILIGTSLVLSMSTAITNPVKANPETDNILISQLAGHDRYDGGSQMSSSDYQLGTVVGKAGNAASIRLEDGSVIGAFTSANAGENVIVAEDDDGNYVVEAAHPAWIDELKEEPYNVKGW